MAAFSLHANLIGVEVAGGAVTAAICAGQSGLFAVKAKHYGVHQLYVNGQKSEKLDLYDPEVVPTGPVELGSFLISSFWVNSFFWIIPFSCRE